MRLTCNVAGSKAVRCWERTEDTLLRRALPDELRDCRLEACVQVGYLRFQAKSFGLCLNISDLLVSESGGECPFICACAAVSILGMGRLVCLTREFDPPRMSFVPHARQTHVPELEEAARVLRGGSHASLPMCATIQGWTHK